MNTISMMHERSIAWLREQKINKKFLVCQERDRTHIFDPDFENWIQKDSWKRPSTCWGDGFETYDHGFSFCNQAPPMERKDDDPFPFIEPIYARYRCPWEHITAIYESSGTVYIFTSKEKQQR